MNTFMKRLLRDEEGQSTTEYIMILAVVVLVAKRFSGEFKTQIGKITGDLTDNMSKVVAEDQ